MDHLTTQAHEQRNGHPGSGNLRSIPKLLRAIGHSDAARGTKQDVIFLEAAALIERFASAMEEVREELAEDFDITDSGGPNKAMRLANMIDEAIYGPGGY